MNKKKKKEIEDLELEKLKLKQHLQKQIKKTYEIIEHVKSERDYYYLEGKLKVYNRNSQTLKFNLDLFVKVFFMI